MRGNIENPDYWRGLTEDGTVTENPWPLDSAPFPYQPTGKEAAFIRREGYAQVDGAIPADALAPLANILMRVVMAGHPSVYALLYDQFYHVWGRLGAALAPILGPEILFVPDEPEAFLILPSDEHSGSPPHRDTLRPDGILGTDGTPHLINTWIPITNATPVNGCMHAIPAHRDPGFHPDTRQDGRPGLQDVRALPVSPGSMLCWSPRLLHWGGHSSASASAPRLSFAAYFQSAAHPPFHPTAMKIGQPIPFDLRLYLVEKAARDPRGAELASIMAAGA